MEYLMTYGWSILIIAVVLGSLAYLGVFNPNTYTPRAPPGSCKVFRVGGNANLEGICSGALPQYVAQFSGSSSYVDVPTSSGLSNMQAITVSSWIYIPTSFSNHFAIASKTVYAGGPASAGYALLVSSSGYLTFVYFNGGLNPLSATFPISKGSWHFVAFSGNTLYQDGTSYPGSAPPACDLITSSGTDLYLGAILSTETWWYTTDDSGTIADVQIYNSSFDPNSIMSLYKEGIGGAPINTQYLVGWWPLNGDVNDYSGNGNNGVPTAVSFTNQWLSGYTTPSH